MTQSPCSDDGAPLLAETNLIDPFNGMPRTFAPTHAELVARVGYPRDVAAAALDRGDSVSNVAFDVAFASDQWEAAAFLAEVWGPVMAAWTGSDRDREFLGGFLRNFGPGGLPCPFN